MTDPVFVIIVLNFIYIGLLPKIFFKKDGRYNLHWWMTAGPLFISPCFIAATKLYPIPLWAQGQPVAAAVLATLSIALISFTLGTHRIPLALWHQNNDAPKEIVTWGAYKVVRHPFYLSFILSQIAALVYAPHWVTLAALTAACLILNYTAAKEEKKLSSSAFGSQYQDYLRKSGRFFPKLGASKA